IVSFIIFDTFRELKEAIMSLIGANYNGPLKDEIFKALRKANINVLKIYVRRLGSFYMVYLIIGLPSNVTLRRA
ncbi:cation transporter, partial [Sulfolobus sp. A20-N-G8]